MFRFPASIVCYTLWKALSALVTTQIGRAQLPLAREVGYLNGLGRFAASVEDLAFTQAELDIWGALVLCFGPDPLVGLLHKGRCGLWSDLTWRLQLFDSVSRGAETQVWVKIIDLPTLKHWALKNWMWTR